MDTFAGLLVVLLLVMANGFFVATEFALVSARRTRIDQLAQEGNAAAVAVQRAVDRLDSFIASTQLGITLASLGLGWVGEPAVARLFDPLLQLLPERWTDAVGRSIATAIAFALVTTVHIVLGELVPKAIALQRPERTAMLVARPVGIFRSIFRPVVFLMRNAGNSIVRLLGFEPASGHSSVHSPEELEMLVHTSTEAGLLEESEERLIQRVFDFGGRQAREVMHPRTEVDALPIDMPLPDLLKLIGSSRYSRYPVYTGSVDTVTGILHVKDVLDAIIKQPQLLNGGGTFDLQSLLHAPLFVPQTAGVDTVLDQMQRAQQQLAVVIDEHGGMAGIATMEDIIEELVGEVEDEFDDEPDLAETKPDALLVDGLTTLNDAIERFGEPGGKLMSTTLGGYIAERLDRIPTVGDTVVYGEYDVRVEAMDGMRVDKVRFIKHKPEHRPKPESEVKQPDAERKGP